jgi:hypothetical protein
MPILRRSIHEDATVYTDAAQLYRHDNEFHGALVGESLGR